MLSRLYRKFGPNPLDRILKKAQKKGQRSFLLFWNRGLGDIPLGLYAIVYRIRERVPDAQITFLTRPNLKDGFALLGGVEVLVANKLKRGDEPDIPSLLQDAGGRAADYDVIIENPNPTHWVAWQRGKLVPELHWQDRWDALCETFGLEKDGAYVGAHVQTETNYAHWRNWPVESWRSLFEKCVADGKKVLLFGFEQDPPFEMEGVIDLRGKTPLFELLSIVKNHCEALVVPDSGVSSMVYFLKKNFPIKHISLWADPNMGILKQNVASPNKELISIPLLGKDKDITTITPELVYEHIR